MEDKITIVVTTDNDYVMLLAAFLKSIEVNLRNGKKIESYIVLQNVSNKNREKLSKSINHAVFQIKWLSLDDAIPKETKLPMDSSSFPRNLYVRLFIPYFIDQDLDKVLFLDIDMIATTDITPLWETDMGDKIIGGVVDRVGTFDNPWAAVSNYKELGLPGKAKFFNYGLALMKPKEWRERHIKDQILKCIEENIAHTTFPDQYAVNVVFVNQYYELDPRWNTFAMSEEPNPYIIHFIGTKPIYKTYDFNPTYKKEFEKYLAMTEWRGFKPKSGLNILIKKLINKIKRKLR